MSRLWCCFGRSKVNDGVEKENETKEKIKPIKSGKEDAKKESKQNQSPVLVELFTSQGCSSCPPADLEFARLGQGLARDVTGDVPVITLAYHVDYWNHLGWRDPFASASWTLRQKAYGEALQQDTIYTPEIVVQGCSHAVGDKVESFSGLIKAASRFPSPDVLDASYDLPFTSTLQVSLTLSYRKRVDKQGLDVMVAIYQNGAVTDCTAGENRGKFLTNEFVVRGLEKACTLQDWPAKKAITGQVRFILWDDFVRAKCGLVVFLQNPSTLEIQGAERVELSESIDTMVPKQDVEEFTTEDLFT
jgi:hypothetical protein